jgi:hypothetical protein
MTGEVIWPHAVFPEGTSGEVFPIMWVGQGSNAAPSEEGLGVASAPDLGADRVWGLRFMMPTVLPAGVANLRLLVLNSIESGDLSVDPSWASVAMDEDPSSVTLNVMGPNPDARVGGAGSGNATFTWETADDDKYLEARWTMDDETITAGEIIVMALRIDDLDTDVLGESALFPSIIFV